MQIDPLLTDFLGSRSSLLTVFYAILSIGGAMAALWAMMCLTRRAGFATRSHILLLVARVALFAYAFTLLISARTPWVDGVQPCLVDVVTRAFSFIILVTAPLLVGGRSGIERLLGISHKS